VWGESRRAPDVAAIQGVRAEKKGTNPCPFCVRSDLNSQPPSTAPVGPRTAPAGALARPAAARAAPCRPATGSPFARGGRLPRRRRAGRLAAPRRGATALPSTLFCRPLVGLAAAARTRFASTPGHCILSRPGTTLRLVPRYAPAFIALFDVPSLTPLLGGVGRLVTTRHDPLQVELRAEDQPVRPARAVRSVTPSFRR
jgi:hypothetical protein